MVVSHINQSRRTQSIFLSRSLRSLNKGKVKPGQRLKSRSPERWPGRHDPTLRVPTPRGGPGSLLFCTRVSVYGMVSIAVFVTDVNLPTGSGPSRFLLLFWSQDVLWFQFMSVTSYTCGVYRPSCVSPRTFFGPSGKKGHSVSLIPEEYGVLGRLLDPFSVPLPFCQL